MIAPVWGFLPSLAFRPRTVKVPNPGNWNRFSFLIDRPMVSNVVSTANSAALLLSCPALATFSTRSPFVITRYLLLFVKVKRKTLPFYSWKKETPRTQDDVQPREPAIYLRSEACSNGKG